MTVSEGDKMDRLPHEKGFHVSWDQLHRDSRALAWRLDGQGPAGAPWRAVVAITRGGMAPAMIVARELDIRMVDTISVKSYDHQSQSEPRVIKCPSRDLVGDGTGVLVVDDLLATGGTAEAGVKLIERLGGDVMACAFVIDLPELGGSKKLQAMGLPLHSLCSFEGN